MKFREIGLSLPLLLLALTVVALLLFTGRNNASGRHQTDQAMKVAQEAKATADRWERIAHQWEAEAKKCR